MSKKPPRTIDPEDASLFRDAAAGARPIPERHVHLPKPAPPARARFRRLDERQVLHESLTIDAEAVDLETGEELSFCRPGVPSSTLRSLRRGSYAIKANLDLHGMTAAEAREALRSFLAESMARGIRGVRIVHGKGLRSGARGPVLKASVNRWLRQWDEVLAFVSAPARDGGTGALYVLLRR